jgi:hypothetical protein
MRKKGKNLALTPKTYFFALFFYRFLKKISVFSVTSVANCIDFFCL